MDHIAGGVLFHIYERPRKHRLSTLICYHVGSERKQLTFRGDLEAAQKHCKQLAKDVTSGEAVQTLHLSAHDRRIYIAAREVLAPLGAAVDSVCREYMEARQILGTTSLIEAIRFYKKANAIVTHGAVLEDVIQEFLAAIKGRAAADRQRYYEDMKHRLGKLSTAFPHARIEDLTAPDLERWLAGFSHLSARSCNKFRAAAMTFCNFAAGLNKRLRPLQRYLPKQHPAHELPKLQDLGGKRDYFTVRELAALLAAAPELLLPCFVLAAFAGLRQSEIWRLEWSDIDFETQQISLDRFQAKTYSERHIQMQEVLIAWLAPYRNREGRIANFAHPNGLTRAMSHVAKGLQIMVDKQPVAIQWKGNGLRHAYATHRIPVAGYALTAGEMGTSERKLLQNYRKPMVALKAEPYWLLLPGGKDVIDIDFAAAANRA